MMSQLAAEEQLAGEYRDRNAGTGGRTVVVGVKLDSQSRELLTWSLVKQAQPGDSLVALHILTNNEIMDRDGKSSLLSLVNSFDSVLAVYEGFCNLKQVDLKLKICRGASVRKVLVRETKAYGANEIIVGTSRNNHTVKSSSSIAKYCAKKLSKSCSIIAVNSGKVVFHRHSPSSTSSTKKGSSDHHKNQLLSLFHKSLSFNPKVLKNGNAEHYNQSDGKNLELALVKYETECIPSALKENCRICSLDPVLPVLEDFCDNGDDDEDNSMALVPVQKLEGSSSSTSLLLRELPELRPGWPLLRRAILSSQLSSKRSRVHQISVVQWAMKLPTRDCMQITNTDSSNDGVFDDQKDGSFEVNEETGAIVCVGGDGSQANLSSPNHDSIRLPKELEGFHEKYSATCRLFQYRELLSATASFKPENMIGKGGNSKVYRGCLPDGKEIAVKILKSSEDVLKEFVLEIEIITALRHQNIISLFGFCFEDNNLLLVYDFLSRGSLEDNLHGNKKNVAFGWSERYKIAVGVAEALVYLHSSCDQTVIHRDVKSSNILLSDDYEPQLSDFGLAKWASTTSSHITCTDVAGTFGYLAPEYFMYGKVTDKIDVYAFGVVLLELLSGRKPISNEYPKGEESLVMWAKPILSSGKFHHLLDKRLVCNYDADQMERMALASTLCIRRAPRARPHMSSVLKLLQGDVEVTKWAKLELDSTGGSDARLQVLEDEGFSQSNLRSHLNLALLDIEDSSLSMSSVEESVSLEDYLRGRWSRSSSFD
uniref:probable receptor-like serine/threonine-protein kinase At5g57670 n=1 Tax=Erigeron canadensis TaxID=72917 RepID=UPI001CB91D2C|nr:probable receptor-like serine/threonine-protein kinase At5g57670 [Erigeron canadensis]